MFRLLRLFFKLLLALVAVGLTFGILLLLNPDWQQAGVEKLLARDPVRKWQIESVDMGLTRLRATQVFVLEDPVGAEIANFEVQGPLWKSLVTRLIEIDSGAVTGLRLDLGRVRPGVLTSSDYNQFLDRVANDAAFWQERLGLVLQKLASAGWDVRLRDLELRGEVWMPGNRLIPVNWRVIEADSRAPGQIRLAPLEPETRENWL